jgi:hypothetical protein
MSRQQDQRRQDHWQGPIAHQQSRHKCLKDGGDLLPSQQYLSRSTVPPLENQTRGPVAINMDFIDRGAEFYEAQMHDMQVRHLKWKAAKLGFQLTEVPAA